MLTEEQIEKAARYLCQLRNEDPEGTWVKIHDDGSVDEVTFLEMAKKDIRALEEWRVSEGVAGTLQ